MDTQPITITDLEDVTQVLGACLTYFQAEDLQTAQVAFSAPRPSPLTMEIERLHTRMRGYVGDFLLARREVELEEEDSQVEDDIEGPENGSENDPEAFEEELSNAPLGEFKSQRQPGRILTDDELQAHEEFLAQEES